MTGGDSGTYVAGKNENLIGGDKDIDFRVNKQNSGHETINFCMQCPVNGVCSTNTPVYYSDTSFFTPGTFPKDDAIGNTDWYRSGVDNSIAKNTYIHKHDYLTSSYFHF